MCSYRTDPTATQYGFTGELHNPLPSGLWTDMTEAPYYIVGEGSFLYVVVYNRTDTKATYQDMLGGGGRVCFIYMY